MDSSLEPLERNAACGHLDVNPLRVTSVSDLQSCKIINFELFSAHKCVVICYSSHRKLIHCCTCSEVYFILCLDQRSAIAHYFPDNKKFTPVQYQNPKFTIDSLENGAFPFFNLVGVGDGLMLTEPVWATPFVNPARRAQHRMPPATRLQPLKTEIENIPFEHPVTIITPTLQIHPADVLCTRTEHKKVLSTKPGQLTIDSGYLLHTRQSMRKAGMGNQRVQGPGRLGSALEQLSEKPGQRNTYSS